MPARQPVIQPYKQVIPWNTDARTPNQKKCAVAYAPSGPRTERTVSGRTRILPASGAFHNGTHKTHFDACARTVHCEFWGISMRVV